MLRRIVKKILVYSPIGYSERLDGIVRLTLLRDWVSTHKPHPYFERREELYQHLAHTVIGNCPISFLEFGVFQGVSIRYWSTLNTNDSSEFIGFDSFEGLPEPWVNVSRTMKRGAFSAGGKLPEVEDRRIRFVKGWFQDTLPAFLAQYSTDRQLIVHCDADLYSSTLFVLCTLHPLLKAGTVVLLDDFSSMLHDFRALQDYTRSFRRQYEVLGGAGELYYDRAAVRFTA